MGDMLGSQEFNNVSQTWFRAIGIDDYAEVRHLHSISYRILTNSHHSPIQIAAFEHLVYSQDYARLMLSNDLWGIWIDRTLAATAG